MYMYLYMYIHKERAEKLKLIFLFSFFKMICSVQKIEFDFFIKGKEKNY